MDKKLFKIQMVSFYTILETQVRKIIRIWAQTLLPPVITMTLYFLIFGTVIGSQVRDIDGLNYMQYIAPGLIMISTLTNAYSHVTSFVFGAIFQRSIEELLVSPTTNLVILLGYIFGGVLRGFLSAIAVLIVAIFFTHLPIKHPFFAIFVVFLSSVLLSLAGFINALYAKRFDDIMIIPTFVLTPLTYLGGVFYSINALPPFWQHVSQLNPILYLINAFRYSFFGISDVPIFHAMLVSSLFTLALFILCYRLLNKGIGLRQ